MVDMPTKPRQTSKRTQIPIRLAPMPLARRFIQICTTAMANSLDGEELTPIQYGVLAYVWGEPDVDQIGLAGRVGVDRTNIGLLIEQLETKGLIARRVSEADRRVRHVRLTPLGETLIKRVVPKVRRGQDRLLEALAPAERKPFMEMLVRVIDKNEALARPGTGRKRRSTTK